MPHKVKSEKISPGGPDTSAAADARRWLDRRLAPTLAVARRRLRLQAGLATVGLALASGLGAYGYASLATSASAWVNLGIAGLATAIPILTVLGLSPILRRRDDWLLETTSTVAHNNIDVLALLGKLTELRDPETNDHSLRVTLYTAMFAEALGLPPQTMVRAVKGAMLHDVGKLVVPDRVLGKPGPHTPEERLVMQAHVQHGIDLLAQAEILQEATPVVAGHHEWFDGTGYPLGARGEAIPLEARLFSIIDVFDALTSPRVYKPALAVADALAIMAGGRGSHFDPTLLDRFVQWAPDFVGQMPHEETALRLMLLERLWPYSDRFTHIGPMLTVRIRPFLRP